MNNRDFTLTMRDHVLSLADRVECGECEGSEIKEYRCSRFTSHCNDSVNGWGSEWCMNNCPKRKPYPCPTCTPERERLRAIAERLCWHEGEPCAYIAFKMGKQGRHVYFPTAHTNQCKHCKKVANDLANPIYTIETIVQYMKDVKEWEWFKFPDDMEILEGDITEKWGAELGEYETSDILVTPSLLISACIAYLKTLEVE